MAIDIACLQPHLSACDGGLPGFHLVWHCRTLGHSRTFRSESGVGRTCTVSIEGNGDSQGQSQAQDQAQFCIMGHAHDSEEAMYQGAPI